MRHSARPRNVSKRKPIKQALKRILKPSAKRPSPYELGKDFFEQHLGTPATEDVARNTNRLLRERFRNRSR